MDKCSACGDKLNLFHEFIYENIHTDDWICSTCFNDFDTIQSNWKEV